MRGSGRALAAKRKRRAVKRKRTSLRPRPFIVIFFIVSTVAGLVASPLTALRKIQVVGEVDWDRARVDGILATLKGKPCALINRYSVESSVLGNSAVRSAQFDRNLFGSGVLTLTYRVPVARFYNHLTTALSEDGTIFQSAHLPDGIPLLDVSGGLTKTYLTIANDLPTLAVAHLAQRIPGLFPQREVRIQYGTGSSLCLNIGTSQVILGSCDELDGKLAKLQTKLASEPDFLARVKTYNLLDPQNPMTVPRQ
jgi:hypothetical protein